MVLSSDDIVLIMGVVGLLVSPSCFGSCVAGRNRDLFRIRTPLRSPLLKVGLFVGVSALNVHGLGRTVPSELQAAAANTTTAL